MRVLSMIDSLIAAGAERMAVNISNGLSEKGIESHLCATHAGGPLEEFVSPKVPLFILEKRNALDFSALRRLKKYIREHRIDIIHAHSSSVYWAVLAKWTGSRVKVIWHDHYGFSEQLHERSSSVLKLMASSISHAFVVNDKLRNYAVDSLMMPENQVSFLANFADINIDGNVNREINLPGLDQYPKLVCLANLRPQKDHHNLLDAFILMKKQHENAVLYLVGGHFSDDYYFSLIERTKSDENLKGSVHILGSRNDVAEILSACDIGVLSSLSEGLPVSLLEYGLAGLPVVCTNVGDCKFVLDGGKLGKLVEPANSTELAEALKSMLVNPQTMKEFGSAFKNHVHKEFSKDGAMNKIIDVYKSVLAV
ncbi:glycosyltransferase [Natronoflexus pectinivorans]|uniref:Glycosyltransferase involved in cell wall biosynthesis n=1 Tax=Natronoflexus pectinivorans TaxID=682526 RepID=A0A4R2GGF5_9BACT|nr:glycosyltransferase [Natronoflexus pectinivorans]TCO06862.1 glycosyltransferase involved in cell wall biosynthesis [Natronoflexus pectinivorans]